MSCDCLGQISFDSCSRADIIDIRTEEDGEKSLRDLAILRSHLSPFML